MECRRAIEAAISSNYGDNRLDADAAVKSVLEQFSPERVRYVLANTIQQKNFDGRIPQPLKEWAKTVDVCPENASRFLVDKPNPGLTALFVDAFRQQTEPQKEAVSEKTEERPFLSPRTFLGMRHGPPRGAESESAQAWGQLRRG